MKSEVIIFSFFHFFPLFSVCEIGIILKMTGTRQSEKDVSEIASNDQNSIAYWHKYWEMPTSKQSNDEGTTKKFTRNCRWG